MARCPSCGGEVDDADDVCPSCGWDFITRQRRPGHEKKAPEPPKKAPPKPEGNKPPSGKDAGRGLLQFPKIDKEEMKKALPPKPGETPFAIPSFSKGEEMPPPPAALPPARKAEPPAREKAPPPTELDEPDRLLKPTPLAAELEEAPSPEPPKTAVRKREAAAGPPRPKDPRVTMPPRPPEKVPLGALIGLASAAVLLISGMGIYMLTRSGEPAARRAQKGAKPFETGGTGAAPAPQPEPVAPTPTIRVHEPEPEPAPQPPVEPARPKPASPVESPKPKPVAEAPRPKPKPEPEPVKPAGNVWVFQGAVYDLINLKVVAGAKMVFQGPGGAEFTTTTDGKGRYKISVPPPMAGTLTLSVSHKDYLDGYIDETSPPLAEAEADERRAIAAANPRNDPWIGDLKKAVKRDFFLIPYNLTSGTR